MEKQKLVLWIQRLIQINSSLKNEQDEAKKLQRVNQLVGYIESLENIDLSK